MNLGVLTADEAATSDKFFHTAGFSLRVNTAFVQPCAALFLPLDEDVRTDLPFVISFGLAATL